MTKKQGTTKTPTEHDQVFRKAIKAAVDSLDGFGLKDDSGPTVYASATLAAISAARDVLKSHDKNDAAIGVAATALWFISQARMADIVVDDIHPLAQGGEPYLGFALAVSLDLHPVRDRAGEGKGWKKAKNTKAK